MGHTVDFTGMQLSHHTILQEQVSKVVLSDGKLRFHLLNKKGKPKYLATAKIKVHEIANFGILYRLLGFTKHDILNYAYTIR